MGIFKRLLEPEEPKCTCLTDSQRDRVKEPHKGKIMKVYDRNVIADPRCPKHAFGGAKGQH